MQLHFITATAGAMFARRMEVKLHQLEALAADSEAVLSLGLDFDGVAVVEDVAARGSVRDRKSFPDRRHAGRKVDRRLPGARRARGPRRREPAPVQRPALTGVFIGLRRQETAAGEDTCAYNQHDAAVILRATPRSDPHGWRECSVRNTAAVYCRLIR